MKYFKSITTISILMFVFLFPCLVHAKTWKTSQAKGEYRCMGSGFNGKKEYVWAGALSLNGKEEGYLDYGIILETGEALPIENIDGNFGIDFTTGVFTFAGYNGEVALVGPLVQAGKGILITVDIWQGDKQLYLLSANCWK